MDDDVFFDDPMGNGAILNSQFPINYDECSEINVPLTNKGKERGELIVRIEKRKLSNQL